MLKFVRSWGYENEVKFIVCVCVPNSTIFLFYSIRDFNCWHWMKKGIILSLDFSFSKKTSKMVGGGGGIATKSCAAISETEI